MSGLTPGDSIVYGHLWATDETRALFDDDGRTRLWLRIIGALAAAQAECGLIPADAAEAIVTRMSTGEVDLEAVGAETRRTGHSTLGLIRVLARDLAEEHADWLYYGATVQDVTDTWTGLVAAQLLDIVARDLGAAHRQLCALAVRHRHDVMLGRTHGQPGLPITFGFKAAGWAAESARHLERCAQARPRLAVVQLAGAVGTMSAAGALGPVLQERFAARLGLAVPDTTWTSARDRVAELVSLLALVTGTLARIGREVTVLARPELGELREPAKEGVVGSITMPQKRNPERSEHLVTLAGVVRGAIVPAFEGMVSEHERDGATWKGEWSLLPAACTAAAASLRLGCELLSGLEVDTERMRANVAAQRGYVLAEPVMGALAARIGKPRAHELVSRAARRGIADDVDLLTALTADSAITAILAPPELAELMAPERTLGAVDLLIDAVVGACPDPTGTRGS
jgi:adenylosuccinate lyase